MSDENMIAANVIATIVWAVTFSVTVYVKKLTRKDNPERFDIRKFVSTVMYAAFVGMILSITGQEITEENFSTLSAQYAIVAILIQNIVSAIERKFYMPVRE